MPEDYILRIDKVVKRFGNVTAVIFHIEYKLRQPRTLITP